MLSARRLSVACLAVGAAVGLAESPAGAAPESRRGIPALIEAIGPALAGRAARIDFVGTCENSADALSVPDIDDLVLTTSAIGSGKISVSEILSKEPRARVTDDGGQLVRIAIGDRSFDLLNAPIPLIEFNNEQRFDEQLALWKVQDEESLFLSSQSLGIEQIMPDIRSKLAEEFDADAPHLPAELRNATLGSALDAIAVTFGSVAIYGECESPRRYLLGVVPIVVPTWDRKD